MYYAFYRKGGKGMEWLKKLSNAIDYIECNLDSEISYEEAAKIACCSTYYFQRMFSYVAGISLSDYIRSRRMTQAAFELQSTDAKVLDIALKYGYSSPTSLIVHSKMFMEFLQLLQRTKEVRLMLIFQSNFQYKLQEVVL